MRASTASEPLCTGRCTCGQSAGELGVGADQRVVEERRVRARVADAARGPGSRRAAASSAAKRDGSASEPSRRSSLAAIGVHGLPEQRDLANAGRGQRARLAQDRRRRAADLAAARERHDAEAAEEVAALHHGQVGAAGRGRLQIRVARPAGRSARGRCSPRCAPCAPPAAPPRPSRARSAGCGCRRRSRPAGSAAAGDRPAAARRSRPRRAGDRATPASSRGAGPGRCTGGAPPCRGSSRC